MTEHVAIVGGGIIGIASADALARAGRRVTVIDKGEIAGACSASNCGYICPSHVLPLTEPAALREGLASLLRPRSPLRIRPRLDPAQWRWLLQFARRCRHRTMLAAGHQLKALLDLSMAEYGRLLAAEPIDCEWNASGLLYVFRTQRAYDAYAATDELLRREFGVAAVRLPGEAVREREPALQPGLAGGFLYEGDASVRPDRLASGWAESLRRRGVDLQPRVRLVGLDVEGGRVASLRTDAGPLAADAVLFAAGAESPLLARHLGMRIPIEPGKGYSVTLPRPPICPTLPMLLPERRVGVSPFEDGYRIGSMMELAGFDRTIPPHRIAYLRRAVDGYLPAIGEAREQERWFGWRPMTWDSLPIIGCVPHLANAYLATGHNMLGLSLAAGTGRLIAELMTGRPPALDLSPFDPKRFA